MRKNGLLTRRGERYYAACDQYIEKDEASLLFAAFGFDRLFGCNSFSVSVDGFCLIADRYRFVQEPDELDSPDIVLGQLQGSMDGHSIRPIFP
ncbi:hypothetical protein D3C74_423190 [compost metagenome]